MSHRNAMIFSSTLNETGPNFAVTRDLDLSKGAVSGHTVSQFEMKYYILIVEVSVVYIYFFICRNGAATSTGCNHVGHNETVYVFNGSGKRQICASLDGKTKNVVAVQFHLSMGSGECQFHGGSNARIEMIGSAHSRRKILSVFFPESYKVVMAFIYSCSYHTILGIDFTLGMDYRETFHILSAAVSSSIYVQ